MGERAGLIPPELCGSAIRRRSRAMKTAPQPTHFAWITLVLSVSSIAASGCKDGSSHSTAESPNPQQGSANPFKAEVVIPAAEQAAQHIQVETAAMSNEPGRLRVPGKIALPDNETWRVGVLAEGRVEHVFANLGDHVRKGDLLANMHSHAVHEAQAVFKIA